LAVIVLMAVLALVVLVYWPGLNGPFLLDDGANLEPLNAWLSGRVGWSSVVFENNSGPLGRPVSMATFVANAALFGVDPWWFKFINLVIHLLNGILVYWLFACLLRQSALTRDTNRDARWLALFGASIWLLHPLLASTVLYVVQRMAMLSTLFTLLAMLAYMHGRFAWQEQHRRTAIVLIGTLVPLCTVLAAFSKENGILAPALCAVVELIAFRPPAGSRRGWLARSFVCAALILPAIAVIILTFANVPFFTGGYGNRAFTLPERVMTESRVLWDYIMAILLPGGPRLGLYHDDFPISHGLLDPATTLLAIGAWFATLVFAWRVRAWIPALALGLGLFLVGQALESSVFALVIYFEHRNYLPAIGIIWAAMGLLAFAEQRLRPRLRHASAIFAVAAIVLVAEMAAGTSVRAHAWSDTRSIIDQALLTHPGSERAHYDSVLWALYQNPPAFARAKKDADWLRNSSDANTARVGAITRALVDCKADGRVEPALVKQIFTGPPGPYEQDLLLAIELLSDAVAQSPCAGLTTAQMAEQLSRMLDRWEAATGRSSGWRLRFRAANLYMASDRNADAIEQAKLAYYKGSPPVSTAIMIAGVLIYCGNTTDAKHILDSVEPRLRASDHIAFQIIADDREKIRVLENKQRSGGT
jgi:hypothetical protein